MKWTVSMHPALAGEIDPIPLSAMTAFIPELLRLQLDGGSNWPALEAPSSILKDKHVLAYRFLKCPGECVAALGVSFINASICVLALIPLKTFSEKTSCDEFGVLVAARYRAVLEAEISPVPMRDGMGWFPSDHVIVAEAAIAIESRRETCCEMMRLAQSEMRSELSDLYNLSGTQRRRLERKYDFMLETLRRKLAPYKASVSLTIRFPDDIQFESESFTALETMSAQSLTAPRDR